MANKKLGQRSKKLSKRKRPRPTSRRFRNLSLILLLFLVATFLALYYGGANHSTVSNNSAQNSTEEPDLPKRTKIVGRYLLSGTIVWDRGVEEASLTEDGSIDPNQPFSMLDTFEPEMYDAWAADLECPTSLEDVPLEVGNSTLEFNCRQEYLGYAAKYFDFFNLSNNHSDNSGRSKLEETRQALSAAGIQHFGDPDTSIKDNICEVVSLPVRILEESNGTTTEVGATIPAAFCAWHYFFRLPLEGELEVITEHIGKIPVFAFVHMGAEYKATADNYQQQVARRLVDLGADFVVSNNPHWVQNTESYKGKPIVYSTGNFIFDQDWSTDVSSNVSLDVSLSLDYDEHANDLIALGPACMAYKDSCLEEIKTLDLGVPSLEYSFDIVAGSNQSGVLTIASPQVKSFIWERTNWQATKAAITTD